MDVAIRKFLNSHILFREITNELFIDALVAAMKTRVFVDGAFIIRKGEIGRAMFFNLKGNVEVISDDGETVINVMGEGSFFGEIGVLYSVPRTASCRSRGKSIILILTKEALDAALEPYPNISEQIAKIAEHRYAAYKKKLEMAVHENFGDDFSLIIHTQDLRKVSLFKDAAEDFLHHLVLSLKPVQCYQNDVIIKIGDVANEMYFVSKGMAHITNAAGTTVFAEFPAGSFFGEIGLLMEDNIRTATVVAASSVVILFKLEKKALDDLLHLYPDIKASIKEHVNIRLEYQKKRLEMEKNSNRMLAAEPEIIRERLQHVSLFKDAEMSFLNEIACIINLRYGLPGEIVVNYGDPGASMFLILDGAVEIVSSNQKQVFGELLMNSYFGEVSLFFDEPRTATVRCKTEAMFAELHRETIEDTFLRYPRLKASIYEVANRNYESFLKRRQQAKELADGNVSIEVTLPKLKANPILKYCDHEFIRKLASRTMVKVGKHGDVIVRMGDPAKEFFIIIDGEVELYHGNVKSEDKILAGGFFGEVGLLKGCKRTATVKVSSGSAVFLILSGSDLKQVFELYTDCSKAIMKSCKERIAKLREKPSIMRDSDFRPLFVPSLKGSNNSQDDKKQGMAARAVRSPSLGASSMLGKRRDPIRSITELSPSELRIALRFASFYSVLKLMSTSQALNKMSKDPSFWPELNFSRISSSLTQPVLSEYVTRIGTHLNVLDLSNCWRVTDDDISLLSEHCKNLRSLTISNCWKLTDKSLVMIARRLLNLTELSISHCQKMRGLGFKGHKLAKLTKLDASYCKQINDKGLEFLVSNSPSISTLILRRCLGFTEYAIYFIARYCRGLKELDLADGEQFTDRSLKWLVTSCENIKKLNFTFCRGISIGGFTFIAQSAANFRYLDFSFCPVLCDELIILFKNLGQLSYLSVRGCPKLTNAIGLHLGKNAKNLQILDVRHCKLIKAEILRSNIGPTKPMLILSDVAPVDRGIVQPGQGGTVRATEQSVYEVYTNPQRESQSTRPKVSVERPLVEIGGDVNVKKLIKNKMKRSVLDK